MTRFMPHIGLRTIKTGVAVALAVFLADLRGSPAPIFAAIAAISAMSRAVGDAFETCRTQFFGIVLGAGCGALFVNCYVGPRYLLLALGIMGLILLCVRLRLQFAVPLACMIFVSVCLSPAEEAVQYGINRLIDTSIGLLTALALNILLKPYNNLQQIDRLLTHFLQSLPDYIEERVLRGRYPDLTPLRKQLARIEEELTVFEKQDLCRLKDHEDTAIFLRGCEQLAQTIVQELSALCAMDEKGRISPENAAGLAALGLAVPMQIPTPTQSETDVVGNYHLACLLRAYGFLRDFMEENRIRMKENLK